METPQAWAAHNGHDEVVKMLLEEEKIGPDHPHDSGRVPLWYAVYAGTWGRPNYYSGVRSTR